MTQNIPLLALVVPTRNRPQYVASAIKSLLAIPSQELEIVIEDNSDSNELQKWLNENAPDGRITYSYSNVQTSQSGNYERSMRGVTAEYVAFIGDDDGVNPEILAATRWAKEQRFDVVVPRNSALFVWPDLQMSAKGAMNPGELRISSFTGQAWQSDPEAELRKCVLSAGQNFHDLPKAYYGIVRRETLEKVRDKTGLFFPGVSPDLAAAIALANVAHKVCILDYPLFLPGASLRSNAGLGGLNKHVGKLEDQPHLGPDCVKAWSAVVPPFFSVQSIWAEAAVESLIKMEREDLLRQFNLPELYFTLLTYYPGFRWMILKNYWPALRRIRRGIGEGTFALLTCFLRHGIRRIKRFYKRKNLCISDDKAHSQRGIIDIQQAVSLLQEYLRTNNWSFSSQGVSCPDVGN